MDDSGKAKERWTVLYLVAYVAAIVLGAALLIPLGRAGTGLWAILAVAGMLLLVRWHAWNSLYRCPDRRCANEFEISTWIDLLSPQWPTRGGGRKYLKCPRCGSRGWAHVLPKRSSSNGGRP